MNDNDWLATQFEDHRGRLRAVAYRMLGSLAEADDAVQDAWLRVSRAGADDVANLGGWLTTIVARVCLNKLRSRDTRAEEPLDDGHLPDPVITAVGSQPEDEAVLADSVGLALQIVIETLSPAERLAFVMHDLFDVPFEEIASVLGRTPQATRQLASRGRRRVRAEGPAVTAGQQQQWPMVDAFFSAARSGDFERLMALLHPQVVLRTDFGTHRLPPGQPPVVRGAAAVMQQAKLGAQPGAELHPALVNGNAGMIITRRGRPFVIMAFTIAGGQITEIDILADPARVARLTAGFGIVPITGEEERPPG